MDGIQRGEGIKWDVIQSTTHSRPLLLKDLLEQKFPLHAFSFIRFTSADFEKLKKSSEKCEAVLAELKTLTENSLKLFDSLIRHSKNAQAVVLVLTPFVFKLLQQKRRLVLDKCIVIMSEDKSLDYLLQLPRFIEEVGRKRILKAQNERLRRIFEERYSHLHTFHASEPVKQDRQVIRQVVAMGSREGDSRSGLKVTLKSWPRLKGRLGDVAKNEILETVSRLISQAVRGSDRVMRASDNEFLILLPNTDHQQLARCKDRINKSLGTIDLVANQKSVTMPFSISILENPS